MIDDILHQIVLDVRLAVEEGHYRDFVARHGDPAARAPSLLDAVRRDAPEAFLAEVKPASPSAGGLQAESDDPVAAGRQKAGTYRAYGATGISVLTERERFKGSLDLLADVAAHGDVPVLMKDFVLHDDQLDAARSAGASAVLFIHHLFARGQTPWELPEAIAAAHDRGLEVLLEVDNHNALDHALTTEADLLGINNRDLTTLQMDLDRTRDLLRFRLDRLGERPVLSLSGIEARDDVVRMRDGGATGVLVGTTLMRADDLRGTLRELRGIPHVKLCGTGHPDDEDAIVPWLAAADAVGVVVDAGSAARERSAEEARAWFDRLPHDVERVVVTTQDDPERIAAHVAATGADAVQVHTEADPAVLDAIRAALPARVKLIALLRLPPEGTVTLPDEGLPKAIDDHVQPLRHSKAVDRILLDPEPAADGDAGGSGRLGDLALAARVVSALTPKRVVLAGGLTPDTVAEALRTVRPWGVDVSSGIEDPAGPKGRKDVARVQAFLRTARAQAGLFDAPEEGPAGYAPAMRRQWSDAHFKPPR